MMELHPITPNDSNDDEIIMVLGAHKAKQVKLFLRDIRACNSEKKRYELCLEKRDQLLDTQSLLQTEFAYYEPTFTESSTYRTSKELDARWQEFTNTAAEGSKNRLRLYKELKKAAEYWGEDLIRHYAVGERGINFAIQFAATARQHRDWKTEALPRLQQLVYRRIQLSAYGRHTFAYPIERIDLTNARSWKANDPFTKQNDPESIPLPFALLSIEQLPDGYCFDEYQLIIPKDVASPVFHGSSGTGIQDLHIVDASSNTEGSIDANGTSAEHTDVITNTSSDTSSGTPESAPETIRPIANNAIVKAFQGEVGATLEDAGTDQPSGQDPGRTASVDIVRQNNLRGSAKNNSQQTWTGVTKRPSSPPKRRSRADSNPRGPSRRKYQAVSPSARCGLDMDRLKALTSKLPGITASAPTASMEVPVVRSKRKRANSLPSDLPQLVVSKRQQVTRLVGGPDAGLACGHDHSARPVCDWDSDEAYLSQTVLETCQKAIEASNSWGCRTAKILLPILQSCKHPTIDEKSRAIEMHVLDGHQAEALLDNTTPDIPVITERQHYLRWRNPARPIPEFFDRMVDHDRMVSVQIPSLEADECSYGLRSIRQVHERFLAAEQSDDPWNILDCSCPLPFTLPDFLTGPNCQLLARVRDKVLGGDRAERVVASRQDWTEWREIEYWALLSEAGHCTAAHMDSHGLSTWITVQEGLFGFAWMSRPTDEQRKKWMENTENYDKGQQWRYWVLKPGQTIFFPSGTIHAVFRTRQTQTLGLGGHILQWTGINRWMDVVSKQVEAPDSTNEDMEDVWKWFPVVEELVQKDCNAPALRIDSGRVLLESESESD